VELANDARDQVMKKDSTREMLVAASIGPYGACLAGGEEYHGDYGKELGEDFLMEWHKNRFEVLVDRTDADILAIETIPCLTEVRAILRLLPHRPHARAWITMSCTDGVNTRSGESFD